MLYTFALIIEAFEVNRLYTNIKIILLVFVRY